MPKSKPRKHTCLSCMTDFDPNRYPNGCPTCARERMNKVFSDIRADRKVK